MDNYCLYYIPKNNLDPVSDMLTIFFGGNSIVDARGEKDGIILLLSASRIIGYVIPNFSKICKIKINGMIYLPNNFLVDVINSVLKNANLEPISYKENSGYVIGKIIHKEEMKKSFLYEVDIKENTIYVESSFSLDVSSLVVIAKENTYLLPGRMISQYKLSNGKASSGRICTFDDLQINTSDIYQPIIVEDGTIGNDFFITEAKVNA